jgi:hypothetical protein
MPELSLFVACVVVVVVEKLKADNEMVVSRGLSRQ